MTSSTATTATVHPIDPGSFRRTPRGLQNRWTIGIALTLLPSFALAHLVTLVLWHLTGSALFARRVTR